MEPLHEWGLTSLQHREQGSDDIPPHEQVGGHPGLDGVNRLPEMFALLPPEERPEDDYLVAAVEGAKIRRGVDNQSQVSKVGVRLCRDFRMLCCYVMLWGLVVYVSLSCCGAYSFMQSALVNNPYTHHPGVGCSWGGGSFGSYACAHTFIQFPTGGRVRYYVLLLGIVSVFFSR